MSDTRKIQLTDSWGRTLNYLRIAVTDRCNLRCFYCMPAEGVDYLPKKELLSYEEILRLVQIFGSLGVDKIRLTGGEPFLRKDFMDLLRNIKSEEAIKAVHITTNGVLTYKYLDELKAIGIDGVNLSIDSLNRENFHKITRRDEFDTVMKTMNGLLERQIKTKINMVVMDGRNDHEILAMADLAADEPVSVRYIEEMPFNGTGQKKFQQKWNHKEILSVLTSHYGELDKIQTDPSNPATLYKIPGFEGNIGIIPAYSRTFCDACNRIRLTATGTIKNCLYDEGVLDIKKLLRSGASDDEVRTVLSDTVRKKAKDGFEAERGRKSNKSTSESMSTIGG